MKASKTIVAVAALGFLAGGATALLAAEDRHPELTRAIEKLEEVKDHLRNTEHHEMKGHRLRAFELADEAIKEAHLAHEE